MLYGIRADEQRRLAREGFRVRTLIALRHLLVPVVHAADRREAGREHAARAEERCCDAGTARSHRRRRHAAPGRRPSPGRRRVRAVRPFLVAGGVDGLLACGTTGEGVLLDRRRAPRASPSCSWRPAPTVPGRGARRSADHGGLHRARGARARGGRRRGRPDRAAVLPARRRGAPSASRVGRERVRPAAVLHLRVRRTERVRDPDRGDRPDPRTLRQRARHEGVGHAVRRGRALPDIEGSTCSSARAVGPGRDGRPARSAPSAAWRRPSRRSRRRWCTTGARARTIHGHAAPHGWQGIPFHAALKEVLVARDVLTSADVRAPLRGLTDDERSAVLALARDVAALSRRRADGGQAPCLTLPAREPVRFCTCNSDLGDGNHRDPHTDRRTRCRHDASPPVLSHGVARRPWQPAPTRRGRRRPLLSSTTHRPPRGGLSISRHDRGTPR